MRLVTTLFGLMLMALPVAADTLTLTWQAPSGNAGAGALQSYQVYRRTLPQAGYPTTALLTVPGTVLTAQDSTVQNGQQYCYVVKAVYAGGVTPPSVEACGANLVTPTDPPLNLRVTFP